MNKKSVDMYSMTKQEICDNISNIHSKTFTTTSI